MSVMICCVSAVGMGISPSACRAVCRGFVGSMSVCIVRVPHYGTH